MPLTTTRSPFTRTRPWDRVSASYRCARASVVRDCMCVLLSLAPTEAQCGVLQFNPEVPDSLKKAILRLHLRPESADGSAVRSKGYQVRLCSTCDLGWCHEFAKRILRPRAKMLEIEVPEEVLKTKEGLHVRLSVFAKGKAGGDTARKQLPCDTAAVQFVTNDTQSVLAPVLLVYKESSPTYLRDLLG